MDVLLIIFGDYVNTYLSKMLDLYSYSLWITLGKEEADNCVDSLIINLDLAVFK